MHYPTPKLQVLDLNRMRRPDAHGVIDIECSSYRHNIDAILKVSLLFNSATLPLDRISARSHAKGYEGFAADKTGVAS